MGFLGYDPPIPDDLELSPAQIRFIRITHPIALAFCFGVGCHVTSVWYKEVKFDHVVYDFKRAFMDILNAAHNGTTDPSRLKRPKLSETLITLSKYSGTRTRDLKGFKGIGDTYIRETYTGFKPLSFNPLPRTDRLDIPFLNNKLSFNFSLGNDMFDVQFVDDKGYFN